MHEWELNDLSSGSANKAFDSGSDTAYGLYGSNAGATWTTGSKFGSAVKFDGSTGYLQSGGPALASSGSSFTRGAWVNPSGPGAVFAHEGTDDPSVFVRSR